jgi:hypothetical protein
LLGYLLWQIANQVSQCACLTITQREAEPEEQAIHGTLAAGRTVHLCLKGKKKKRRGVKKELALPL